MVFFSKDKKTAQVRLNKLAQTDKKLKGKKVTLAKQQIPHISKWKTWKVV